VTDRAAKRVLVTGAYGFIGRAYCDHLAARKVPHVGIVRAREPGETRDEIVAAGDFAEAEWARPIIDYDVDCIVHLAARSHRLVDDASDPAAAYRRANVEATRELLEAARDAGVRRFVFASTVKVHGDYSPPGVVWSEADRIDPKDDYARSKAEAEAWVGEFGSEHAIETVILRFPLVYGPGVKANFAALVDGVRNRRWLPLGGIRNRRSLLGLANACSALDAAREHPDAAGRTFLVSEGDDVSTPELVRAIADALQVKPRLLDVPPWLLETLLTLLLRRADAQRLLQSLAIDSARIRRSLAWTPPSTLHDELERLVRSLPRR
jgi:UDP-glucose 4-epimerase